MANLSKETLDRCISNGMPCTIFHPWSSNCFDGIAVFSCNLLYGCSKFFLPIYIAKLLLNWKKFSKKYFWEQILAYLRTLGYGITFGTLFIASCCTFAKFNASYFILMQAGAIGGLSLLLESRENKQLDKILFFNQLIETLINTLTSRNVIKRTRWTETLAFMFVTSTLMYLFKTRVKNQNLTHLWFYPETSIHLLQSGRNGHITNLGVCKHKKTCLEFCKEGAHSYFIIGYLLEIVRKFLPNIFYYSKRPLELFTLVLNKNNFMMGLFLGGYVTVYRYATCYFQTKERQELPSHALIAAFIASSMYCLKPNLQLFIIAFTTTMQLLWEKFLATTNIPACIPYSQILFCVSSGILLHYCFILPDQCPKYVKNMVDIATNNMSRKLYNMFISNIEATEKYMLSAAGI